MKLFSVFGELLLKDDLSKKLDVVEKKAQGTENVFSKSFKRIGGIIAGAFVVDKMVDFGKQVVETSANIQALDSQFQQTFKGNEAAKAMDLITQQSKQQGINVDRLKGQWAGFYGTFRGNGSDANQSLDLTNKYMNLAADGAAYYDLSLEDVSSRLKSITMGNFEAGDAIGVNINATKMDTIAKEKYGKSWQKLNDTEKEFLLIDTVGKIYQNSGALGQGSREANNLSNVMGNLKSTWDRFISVVGAPILNIAVQIIGKLTDKVTGLVSNMNTNGVGNFVNGIKSAITTLSPIIQGIIKDIGQIASKILPSLGVSTGDLGNKILSLVQGGLTTFKAMLDWVIANGELVKVAIIGIGTAVATIKVGTGILSVISGINNIKKAADGLKGMAAISKIFTTVFGFNPMLLIIAASIAAIAGLAYLIITNWGSISTFFSNLWNGISTTVVSVWTTITTAITNFVTGIVTTISSIWTGLIGIISGIWNTIVTIITSIVMGIVTGVLNLFSGMQGGINTILTGIQQFIGGIWQVIKNVVLGVVLLILDLVTGNFSKLSSDAQGIFNNLKNAVSSIFNGLKNIVIGIVMAWAGLLSTIWNGIKNIAISAWNNLKSAIMSIANGIVNGAINIFNGVLNFFASLPGRLYNLGSSAFNALKNGITGAIGGIASIVQNGFNGAINFITSLPSKAVGWGKDFIQGLINGITGMIGGVVDAVSGVADKIRSFLHFSVPDEGPLTDYESWMPDFMTGLTKGIDKNKYKVTDAIKGLSSNMSVGFNPNSLNKLSIPNNINPKINQIENKSKQPVILQTILNSKVIAQETYEDISELQEKKTQQEGRNIGYDPAWSNI